MVSGSCGVAATGVNTVVLTCTSALCAAIRVDKVYYGLAETTSNVPATAGACAVRAVSSADTATATDCTIHGTGTFTETLYASTSGASLCIKNAGTGIVTVDGNAAETIDGELTQDLPPDAAICIYGFGGNWYIK